MPSARSSQEEKTWLYIAASVWITIALATLIRGVVLYHTARHVGVYPLFEQSGSAWVHSQPIYSSDPGLFVFRYSPLTAALMSPLSLMPDNVGSGVVRMASLTAFLAGLWWWSRSVLPVELDPAQRAVLFLFAAPLAFQALGDVQTTGLAIGLMLLGTAAIADDKLMLGIACLVLATMIKAYPIALLGLLVLIYPRRLAWRSVVVLAVALAIPFALQRPSYVWHQYADWWHFGLNMREAEPGSHQLVDIRELLETLHLNLDTHQYLLLELTTAAAAAVLAIIVRLRAPDPRTVNTLTFGLATCWMTVLGPATESQTYIVVAPIVAWLMLAVCIGAVPAGYRWVALPLYILFALTQFILWFPFHARLRPLAPHSLAGLMLLGALIVLILRTERAPQAAHLDGKNLQPARAV